MANDNDAGKRERRTASPWSFQIAKLAGIPVRLHFTFLLFLGWIYASSSASGGLNPALLMAAIFGCIVLHEFGHALTAKRYGIRTRDITLYPIGGVAMLQGRPKPAEELWIALAGPAVNVAIALLSIPLSFMVNERAPRFANLDGSGFIDGLFTANVVLAAFNMIPAFPMDGGRVLRALLGRAIEETRATQIAGTIGQFLAVGIGLLGVLSQNLLLVLVAFFVYLGAAQEVQATLGYSLVAGKRIADAMQTRFRTIGSGETLDAAAKMLLDGSQHDFPVVLGDEVIGVLGRSAIASGLAAEGPGAYVAGHMRREFMRFSPDQPLSDALDRFAEEAGLAMLVFEGGALIGMLTQENLSEFIMLEHARAARKPDPFRP